MKSVEIAYEVRPRQSDSEQAWREMALYPAKEAGSHLLVMRNINWPSQCPCCLSEETSSYHTLKCEVNWKVDDNTRYFFPLEWRVPYCSTCLDHVKMHSSITIGVSIAWVVLLALGGAFSSEYLKTASVYLQIAAIFGIGIGSGALCLWLNKVLKPILVVPRKTPTCVADGNYAVSAPSVPPGGKVQIYFESDAYADAFFALNGV